MRNELIYVADIIADRQEDGPGIRTVCFLQGCIQKCKDCHNPETWDMKMGTSMKISEVVEKINETNNPFKRVTISGGEPMLQEKKLKKLINSLHILGYEIALYTSFNLEEIPFEILEKLKYLKIGKFVKEKKIEGKFYGSSNQKFYELRKGEIIYEL